MKITITFKTQPEDETPEQSEERTGSAAGYAKAVRQMQKVARAKRKGSRWGWCTVEVVAEAVLADGRNATGHAYLGNCSYASDEDFCCGGYAEQMIDEAVTEALKGLNLRSFRLMEEKCSATS